MITTIISFKTDDGVVFDKKEDAQQHLFLSAKAKSILAPFGTITPSGATYIQHPPGSVHQAQMKFLQEVGAAISPEVREVLAQTSAAAWNRVYRILDEKTKGAIRKVWWRLSVMDPTSDREYEQPYYLAHPGEAKEQFSYKAK